MDHTHNHSSQSRKRRCPSSPTWISASWAGAAPACLPPYGQPGWGQSVALVEKMNCFGGVATSGMVNIWHSLQDTEYKQQIIGGLTVEVIERLKKRDAVIDETNTVNAFMLNTEELKIELDELVRESKIKAYLHTSFAAPLVEEGKLKAVFVENKSGRGAIRAKVFIDATGDGDLFHQLGLPRLLPADQTASHHRRKNLWDGLRAVWHEQGSRTLTCKKPCCNTTMNSASPNCGAGSAKIPGVPNVTFQAISRVFYADCADGDSLTHSEMEGRRQIRAIMDIIRKYGPQDYPPGAAGAWLLHRHPRNQAFPYTAPADGNGCPGWQAVRGCHRQRHLPGGYSQRRRPGCVVQVPGWARGLSPQRLPQ